MLTLFGIVLAIGIVVDDAIVVVENTSRHLDCGARLKRRGDQGHGRDYRAGDRHDAGALGRIRADGIHGRHHGTTLSPICPHDFGRGSDQYDQRIIAQPRFVRHVAAGFREKKFFFFRWFNKTFDRVTSIYSVVIGGMVRRIAIVMIVFLGLIVATGWSFGRLPTGFLPTEDQGYCFVNVQLPDAASRQRTDAVMRKLDEIVANTPGVVDWVSVSGFSLLSGNNGSNLGLVAVVYKSWDERTTPEESQPGIVAHLQREFAKVEDAVVFAFVPPSIDGLGNAGGFQMQLQDRGGVGLAEMQNLTEEMIEAGNAQSGLTSLNTTFRASVPQLFAEIDRTKVKTLDIPLGSVFSTLQAYLGSAYVNDFNEFGRTWQVRVQAGQQFRVDADDIKRLDVRNNSGDMIPVGTFVEVQETFGPQVIQRYNLYPSAQVNGSPAPGYSSGQALTLMEQMAAEILPNTMGFAWTGMSYQEKQLSDSTKVTENPSFILLLSVVFVFLVLAAQYESWTSPAAVISVVPLAAAGVVIAVAIARADINIYSQIGLVLLVALASKNAILIVEFASEQRREGLSIREAAARSAELRFRAILMTAFSSILGFLPLLVASGAGAASRVAVGLAVVGGMIAATFFSLLFVPSFFVVFQTLSEIRKKTP